jgi:hypothetical protein
MNKHNMLFGIATAHKLKVIHKLFVENGVRYAFTIVKFGKQEIARYYTTADGVVIEDYLWVHNPPFDVEDFVVAVEAKYC